MQTRPGHIAAAVVTAVTATLAGAPSAAVPPSVPIPHTPLAVFRSRLDPTDPDRNWTYYWTADGSLGAPPTASPATVLGPRPIPATTQEDYDPTFHGGVSVTPATPPGQYTVDVGRGPELTLTVVPPKVYRAATVQPGVGSLAAARAAVAAGVTQLVLAPGEHVWGDMLTVPPGTQVRGYGAVLRRVAGVNYGGNWPAFYVAGSDVSVYGLTVVYDFPGQVFLSNPTQTGLVVADCTFKRCNFGFYYSNCFIRDCIFDGGGAAVAPGGLWLRCRFVGPANQHAWDYWANLGPVGVVECTFDKTDRGPVFNAAYGPITDCLFVNVRCANINWFPNGNEIFLCEGPGAFDRNIFLHTRVSGCQSMVFQIDQVSHNCVVRDLFVDGGGGVLLWGTAVSGWDFQYFELRNGAGIYCGPTAVNNRFRDGTVVRWAPGRVNQTYPNKTPLLLARTTAVLAEGPAAGTNTLINVDVEDMPAKYTGVTGFGVSK